MTEVFHRKKFQEFFRLVEVLMSMGHGIPAFGLVAGGGNRPSASATGRPVCVEVVRGKGLAQGGHAWESRQGNRTTPEALAIY